MSNLKATVEILVIDDDLAAAQEFAELITNRTQLTSFATDNPQQALEKMHTDPVKVVVLDQRMPRRSGTDLLKDLMSVDPGIKVIMFSGEANAQEVGEGFSSGLVDYLHKGQIEQLPNKVLLQYTKYYVDYSRQHTVSPPQVIHVETRGFLFGSNINYVLHSLEVLTDDHVFEHSWSTIKQLNAGESVKEADTIEVAAEFIDEMTEESKLALDFGISIPTLNNLKTGVQKAISTKYSERIAASRKSQFQVIREYKLPQEPSDPSQLYVVSRHYQRAPVYRRIRCLIVRECGCCLSRLPFPLVIYHLTSRIATRQRDHLSDRTIREIPTGIESY